MNSSDAKVGPETCTQGIASLFVFQILAPTKTGDHVVFGKYDFLCGESKKDLIGIGLH
jgi:hypothetical protein